MSAAQRNKGAWLTQNYDKLLLVVVLVGLLASAVFLVLGITSERSALLSGADVRPPRALKEVEESNLEAYQPRLDQITTPLQSRPTLTNAMMVSELRVVSVNPENIPAPIPYSAEVCPFTNHPQPAPEDPRKRDSDANGLPDWWEEQYGLDILNAEDAYTDLDGDGFNNSEEYQAGTDPSDPSDYPDLVAKLRLVRAVKVPFILRFQGIQSLPGGKTRYQVNLRSLAQTYFVDVGDEVQGFKVASFDPDAPGGQTLVLEKDGKKIPLVKGRKVDRHEVVAGLVFLLDGTRFKKRIGEELVLKDQAYKVVDIKPNAVSIIETATGRKSSVGRLTLSEKNKLLGIPDTQEGVFPPGDPSAMGPAGSRSSPPPLSSRPERAP